LTPGDAAIGRDFRTLSSKYTISIGSFHAHLPCRYLAEMLLHQHSRGYFDDASTLPLILPRARTGIASPRLLRHARISIVVAAVDTEASSCHRVDARRSRHAGAARRRLTASVLDCDGYIELADIGHGE
jgi:hypothetical protein